MTDQKSTSERQPLLAGFSRARYDGRAADASSSGISAAGSERTAERRRGGFWNAMRDLRASAASFVPLLPMLSWIFVSCVVTTSPISFTFVFVRAWVCADYYDSHPELLPSGSTDALGWATATAGKTPQQLCADPAIEARVSAVTSASSILEQGAALLTMALVYGNLIPVSRRRPMLLLTCGSFLSAIAPFLLLPIHYPFGPLYRTREQALDASVPRIALGSPRFALAGCLAATVLSGLLGSNMIGFTVVNALIVERSTPATRSRNLAASQFVLMTAFLVGPLVVSGIAESFPIARSAWILSAWWVRTSEVVAAPFSTLLSAASLVSGESMRLASQPPVLPEPLPLPPAGSVPAPIPEDHTINYMAPLVVLAFTVLDVLLSLFVVPETRRRAVDADGAQTGGEGAGQSSAGKAKAQPKTSVWETLSLLVPQRNPTTGALDTRLLRIGLINFLLGCASTATVTLLIYLSYLGAPAPVVSGVVSYVGFVRMVGLVLLVPLLQKLVERVLVVMPPTLRALSEDQLQQLGSKGNPVEIPEEDDEELEHALASAREAGKAQRHVAADDDADDEHDADLSTHAAGKARARRPSALGGSSSASASRISFIFSEEERTHLRRIMALWRERVDLVMLRVNILFSATGWVGIALSAHLQSVAGIFTSITTFATTGIVTPIVNSLAVTVAGEVTAYKAQRARQEALASSGSAGAADADAQNNPDPAHAVDPDELSRSADRALALGEMATSLALVCSSMLYTGVYYAALEAGLPALTFLLAVALYGAAAAVAASLRAV